MKAWAASKYFLRVTEKDWPGSAEDGQYTYHDDRDAAVVALIQRETAAIEKQERRLKNDRLRLRNFIKKHGAA